MQNLRRQPHDTCQRGHKQASGRQRAAEVNLKVRKTSRWFEPWQTRWGVEPHRVAEARGNTPVAGQVSDALKRKGFNPLASQCALSTDVQIARK